MEEIANNHCEELFKDKIVADFGCGPRGSLAWTNAPKIKIGIDVLSDRYWDTFGEQMKKHGMVYVKSTENWIPLPDQSVDVVITINSLDHVDNLSRMSDEIKRILRPRGVLLGNFNLFEPACDTEPQMLTEEKLSETIFNGLRIKRYAVRKPEEELYCGHEIKPGCIDLEYGDGSSIMLLVVGVKK